LAKMRNMGEACTAANRFYVQRGVAEEFAAKLEVHRSGRTFVPLTRRAGGLQAFKMICPPGRDEQPDPRTHEGYEWLYVLEGRLRLVLGDRDLVLKPGEAAEFDTHVPHWFGSADERPVELLSLFGTQGERAHVRARAGR
ncbi:cupin domain-containing protein, partial [Pseudonocardia sp. NPDC049154]|uniref:cupin domain-containing protein n=1 Tax=Pseudonocardia sp. NPDC049154 TaxID=3155501 RepID=UPI0033C55CF4